MKGILDHHQLQIKRLCEKYQVQVLELFGSAARGDFNPESSDLDFLVLFEVGGTVPVVDRYLRLQEALESLLGRKVDLVDIQSARNPYFIADALRHRVRLYAA